MPGHSKPRFRVGQRVRVLASTYHPHLVGKVTVVIAVKGIFTIINSPTGKKITAHCYEIQAATPTPGRVWAEFQLAPVYDGDEASSWENMRHLWAPDHLRVNEKELEKA